MNGLEYDTGTGIPWIRVVESPPQEGSITGGTPIAILGSNFPPWVSVTIGGNPLTQMEVTDTLIRGITPRGTEGEWDILITASPDYCILAGKFIYKPPSKVVVTGIVPTSGKQAGGDVGIIAGSGFLPGATVTIGGAPATDVGVTPALITLTIPPGTEGAKDVVVTNPDGQKDTLHDGFTYNPMPTITRIAPDHGTAAGGTKLTIEGTGFLQGARVMIGERVGTTMVKDDVTIEAVTPPNPPGILDVHVINPDTQKPVMREAFVSVGELVYNYPNPFRASEGTTFRYVTNQYVEVTTVRIFNLRGVPIGIVRGTDSNEVRWHNPSVHPGLYVYLLEARIEGDKVRRFKNMLEVRK
jgi:hypothetical protein